MRPDGVPRGAPHETRPDGVPHGARADEAPPGEAPRAVRPGGTPSRGGRSRRLAAAAALVALAVGAGAGCTVVRVPPGQLTTQQGLHQPPGYAAPGFPAR
ncbi:hypothetical protein ACSNOD_29670, partial [Streptomyces sp. URMC 123]